MNKLIRTFYPVGQGAFYVEKHTNNGNVVNIVYDCGTSTHPSNDILVDNIFSSFNDGDNIDILFISHFDDDHINGISILKKRCHIKNVIIPLIKDEDKIIFKICNYFNSFNHRINNELIDSPEAFFGDKTNVIKVDIYNPERNNENDFSVSPMNIETLSKKSNIQSGQPIKLNNDVQWQYIPFNYEYSKRASLFEKELEKANIKDYELSSIDFISSRVDDLRSLYKIIPGNINANSLILFSGIKRDKITENIIYSPSTDYPYPHCFAKDRMGCLYLGDANLNERLIIQLRKHLNNLLWGSIGIIQVPHHGSKNNFSEMMLILHPYSIMFVSYGTKNKYKHPSQEMVSMIMHNHSTLYKVTEEEVSILYQMIEY